MGKPAVFLLANQGWARGQTLRSKCTAAKPVKPTGKGQAGQQVEEGWEGFFLSIGGVGLPLPECSFPPRTPSVGVEGVREDSR